MQGKNNVFQKKKDDSADFSFAFTWIKHDVCIAVWPPCLDMVQDSVVLLGLGSCIYFTFRCYSVNIMLETREWSAPRIYSISFGNSDDYSWNIVFSFIIFCEFNPLGECTMKIGQITSLITITMILSGLCSVAKGFANKTHKAISEKATQNSYADSFLKNELGLNQGLGTTLLLDQSVVPAPERIPTVQFETRINPELPSNPCTVLDFLKVGAHLEDVPNPRARHHFHSPIANPGVTPPNPNSGLDNKTDHPNWAWIADKYTQIIYGLHFDLTGASAQQRALGTEGAAWETEYENYFAWPDTRTYFYRALTRSNLAERNHYLALTFLSLGQTVHLLEDMGVPAHTRNDFVYGHMKSTGPKVWKDWGNRFEDWVEEQVIANGGESLWLGTGPVVFDKLAEYFDADAYTGGYLGDGIIPPAGVWGLSECTNYQFLSFSTVFGCSGVKYQFPHPAIEHTSQLFMPVPAGYKIYFDGSDYGVTHLARESYTYYRNWTGAWAPAQPVIDSTNTTDDEQVFEDYADITIPRTIDYATGMINYFFRGRLSVEPNWADANIVELAITNASNNSGVPQFLKGGTFELYWDDGGGNRAVVDDFAVSGWQAGSTLDYNDTVTATFTRQDGASKYVLVYAGDICENTHDTDSDDPNAIAVCVIYPGFEIAAWGRDDYGQVNDVPQGSDFIAIAAGKRHCLAIKVDGSLVGWGYNNHGECDVPAGNDYVDIAAGVWHSIALKSDGSIVVWGDDGSNQITDKPNGNDFVAVAAGDYHSLALKSDGSTIVGWGGWNTYGECDAPAPETGTVYTAIAAGKFHSLALQSDGTVRAWGSNNQGQTRVYDGAASEVHVAVAACANYNLLLRDDEMLIAWGGGDWLEPGIPRYHYRQPDGTDFVAIAAGWEHILALTSDGEILSWDWPQGNYPFDYFSRFVPDDLVFTDDVSASYDFSVVLGLP